MDTAESIEKTVATEEIPATEDATTITVTPATEEVTVMERHEVEETRVMPDASVVETTAASTEKSIIERVSITIDALTGFMAAIDILGLLIVISFFVYLGLFRKKKEQGGQELRHLSFCVVGIIPTRNY